MYLPFETKTKKKNENNASRPLNAANCKKRKTYKSTGIVVAVGLCVSKRCAKKRGRLRNNRRTAPLLDL